MHINPVPRSATSILEDIERRWDNPTEEERVKLGRLPGQGRAKLFEVRETESDVSLLRNYLTKDLIEDLDLYLYDKEGDEWVIVEKNWEKVRDGIVASMTNFGYPYITIEDADFNRNSELLLQASLRGHELDVKYAQKTLEYVYADLVAAGPSGHGLRGASSAHELQRRAAHAGVSGRRRISDQNHSPYQGVVLAIP